ncbi:MAG: sigma-70 family RNA polymerase sigma factor [Lachnospiraceae bacterium]|nr:sigma-70 family RNA polymerase sigma factor [Lachnospiraceae bacterium]
MDNGASSYRRFLAGQDEGLREIIDLYYDGLSLYLNTYLNNLTDAEDCAEETMIVLATKKPNFSGHSSFKTWLYAIGRNLAIDRLRRKPPETEPLSEELVCGEYGQRSAEAALLEQEERERLTQAMNDLKPDYRRVLKLRFYDGMDLCDIAKVMGKSSAGIYHLFERAKKSLRMKLGNR